MSLTFALIVAYPLLFCFLSRCACLCRAFGVMTTLLNLKGVTSDAGWAQLRALVFAGYSISRAAQASRCSRAAVQNALREDRPPSQRIRKVNPRLRRKLEARRTKVVQLITRVKKIVAARKVMRRGRPRKDGRPRESYIVERVLLKPQFPSPAAVASHLQTVSRSTVYRDARASLRPYARPKVPPLPPANQAKRHLFCNKMLRQPKCFFKTVLFSDEKLFTTNDCGGRFQWLPYKQRKRVLGREQQSMAPKVMVWGFIGVGCRHLVILDLPKGDGGVTGAKYVKQCLKPALKKMKGRVLQQDGARCHWTKDAKGFLCKNAIKVLQGWPAGSPDLSPVENMWAIVQRRVSDRGVVSIEALKKATLEEWRRVPRTVVDRLALSFKSRCKECAGSDGAALRK